MTDTKTTPSRPTTARHWDGEVVARCWGRDAADEARRAGWQGSAAAGDVEVGCCGVEYPGLDAALTLVLGREPTEAERETARVVARQAAAEGLDAFADERAGDERAPSTYPRTKLARDTRCITVHGTTGQDLDEGTLPAGALVADLRVETTILAGYPVTATHFTTSTDGGRTWHRQRTYGPVELESWQCGPGCSCGHPDHDLD